MGTGLGSSAPGVRARQVLHGPDRPPVRGENGVGKSERPQGGPSTPYRGLEGPREPVIGRRRPSLAHFLEKGRFPYGWLYLCVRGEVANVR